MTISAERRAAEERVAEALSDWRAIIRREQDEAPGVITGWAAVLGETTYDDEGDPQHGYPICSPWEQPFHVDIGLFRIAANRTEGWAQSD